MRQDSLVVVDVGAHKVGAVEKVMGHEIQELEEPKSSQASKLHVSKMMGVDKQKGKATLASMRTVVV